MVANDVEMSVANDRDHKKIREHWLELSRKYESSGMTRENFCAQEKIKLFTFDSWRAKFKREGLVQDVPRSKGTSPAVKRKKSTKQPNALLPVVITQAAKSAQAIEIKTRTGHVVSLPVSVCPTVLKEVFKALGDL
jgi:hypothetical protein